MQLTPLNLPFAHLKLSKQGDSIFVWCVIRKKKLVLTPEEWVRQHLIHYLIEHKNIPKGNIASEISIHMQTQHRRCDILVYNSSKQPFLLIECKAPQISINGSAIRQAVHYNNQLSVPFVAVSNGLRHEIFEIDYKSQTHITLDDFPFFI